VSCTYLPSPLGRSISPPGLLICLFFRLDGRVDTRLHVNLMKTLALLRSTSIHGRAGQVFVEKEAIAIVSELPSICFLRRRHEKGSLNHAFLHAFFLYPRVLPIHSQSIFFALQPFIRFLVLPSSPSAPIRQPSFQRSLFPTASLPTLPRLLHRRSPKPTLAHPCPVANSIITPRDPLPICHLRSLVTWRLTRTFVSRFQLARQGRDQHFISLPPVPSRPSLQIPSIRIPLVSPSESYFSFKVLFSLRRSTPSSYHLTVRQQLD
jgi:hypothetical protein